MLTAAITTKLIAEIALLALLAQGLVGLLAGAARHSNPVYRLLEGVGKPWLALARLVMPRFVLDQHLPLVAFLGLLLVWAVVTLVKVRWCLAIGVSLCQ